MKPFQIQHPFEESGSTVINLFTNNPFPLWRQFPITQWVYISIRVRTRRVSVKLQVIKRTIKRGQKWPLVHCPFPSFFTSNVKGALGTTIRIKNRYPGESDEHESDHRYSPAKPDPPLLTPENHLFFLHLLYLHISKNEDQKGFSRISLSQVVSENKKQPKQAACPLPHSPS